MEQKGEDVKEIDVGAVKITLEKAIKASGLSKNKVAQLAGMQRTQLNNYCKGNIQRFDLDILARLCTALECPVSDILEFVPPDVRK